MLELGEELLDGVQVGRIFWQEEELGAGRTDQRSHDFSFVAAEIIYDDDIAGAECGNENVLDIISETFAIDGAVNKPRSFDRPYSSAVPLFSFL
jgi:hypothetical protein